MTTHKEALTLALEAFKRIKAVDKYCDILSPSLDDAVGEAVTAIKEALAQPEQEPVGEAYLCDLCHTPFDGAFQCPSCGHGRATKEPVYTTPPQRKPLTDEQRMEMWRTTKFRGNGGQLDWFIAGTHAAEAAHGIKE